VSEAIGDRRFCGDVPHGAAAVARRRYRRQGSSGRSRTAGSGQWGKGLHSPSMRWRCAGGQGGPRVIIQPLRAASVGLGFGRGLELRRGAGFGGGTAAGEAGCLSPGGSDGGSHGDGGARPALLRRAHRGRGFSARRWVRSGLGVRRLPAAAAEIVAPGANASPVGAHRGGGHSTRGGAAAAVAQAGERWLAARVRPDGLWACWACWAGSRYWAAWGEATGKGPCGPASAAHAIC
jgi:hypothetical protein